MLKKRSVVLFFVLVIFLISIFSVVSAQEEKNELICLSCGEGCYSSDEVATMFCPEPEGAIPDCGVRDNECVVLGFIEITDGGCGDFDCDELEIGDAGTTPDSIFYFLDEFFDGFGDDIEVKEEKVAEIKAMIESGKIEDAREALENYLEEAEKLEKEVTPDERDEAVRSAETIKEALKELEDKIEDDEREEFVEEVIGREDRIATAAEIAGKINELCQTLSELDPSKYYDICKSDDDSPNWQKKLDKKLTKEQRDEAKKFGKIMRQCFETSGQICACDEIPFPDFARACSKAAPLATACDVEGDEKACELLDNLKMPDLPPHLQQIFDSLEDVNEARYDLHMPSECIEAGATTPKECGRIMIETHAPTECKQPLLDSGCDSERECREICDKIMMDIHAPDCAEKGISDPNECARYMESSGGEHRGQGREFVDFNCKEIDDPMERLDCYDKSVSQASSHAGFDDVDYDGPCMTQSDWADKKRECRELYGKHAGDEPVYGDSGNGYECTIDAKCVDFGNYEEEYKMIKVRERECANQCESEGKAWDFSGGSCYCKEGDYDDSYKREDTRGPGCDDCSSQCPAGANTDCVNDRCVCGEVPDTGPTYAEGEGPGSPEDYEGEAPSGEDSEGSGGESDFSEDNSVSSESSSVSESSSSSSEDSSSESDNSGGGSESGAETTGAVITGNAFLDYYYR